MTLVPVVDISNPGATSLAALDTACRDHGFFLLSGHGLDDVIARTFDAAHRFFHSEPSVKEAIRRDAVNPLGYNDRELTKRRRDHKEVFDFVDPVQGRSQAYNRWPEVDGFREAMVEHYDACSDLAARTTDLVLAALGMPERLQRSHRGDRTTSNMRLNHYTLGDPVPESERVAVGESLQALARSVDDMARLADMDVVDICVPTPLRKTKDPDLSYVVKAVEAAAAEEVAHPDAPLAVDRQAQHVLVEPS